MKFTYGCKDQNELDYFNKLSNKYGVSAREWAEKNMKPSKYKRFSIFLQINGYRDERFAWSLIGGYIMGHFDMYDAFNDGFSIASEYHLQAEYVEWLFRNLNVTKEQVESAAASALHEWDMQEVNEMTLNQEELTND